MNSISLRYSTGTRPPHQPCQNRCRALRLRAKWLVRSLSLFDFLNSLISGHFRTDDKPLYSGFPRLVPTIPYRPTHRASVIVQRTVLLNRLVSVQCVKGAFFTIIDQSMAGGETCFVKRRSFIVIFVMLPKHIH
jgi:hypothetical protein